MCCIVKMEINRTKTFFFCQIVVWHLYFLTVLPLKWLLLHILLKLSDIFNLNLLYFLFSNHLPLKNKTQSEKNSS